MRSLGVKREMSSARLSSCNTLVGGIEKVQPMPPDPIKVAMDEAAVVKSEVEAWGVPTPLPNSFTLQASRSRIAALQAKLARRRRAAEGAAPAEEVVPGRLVVPVFPKSRFCLVPVTLRVYLNTFKKCWGCLSLRTLLVMLQVLLVMLGVLPPS